MSYRKLALNETESTEVDPGLDTPVHNHDSGPVPKQVQAPIPAGPAGTTEAEED